MSIEIERAEAITWIRIQMAQHGLTLARLQAAGCFTEPAAGAIARGGALSQRARAGLGRPWGHAGLAAASGQCRADRGTFPHRVALMRRRRPMKLAWTLHC